MKNILTASNKLGILKEIISVANELDEKGFSNEASALDKIAYEMENKSEDGDNDSDNSEDDGSDNDEDEQKPLSKWHKMKMTRLVEEMNKNEFKNLSFEIDNYHIHVGRKSND